MRQVMPATVTMFSMNKYLGSVLASLLSAKSSN